MAKVCQLFSGSSGNSILVSSSGHNYLVDIGVSAKNAKTDLIKSVLSRAALRAYLSLTSTGTTQKASEFLQTDTKFRFMPPSFAMMNFTGKVLRMIKQILIL